MVEVITYTILLLAAVVGFAHILSMLEQKLLHSKHQAHTITVVPLSGHVEEMELLIRELRTGRRRKENTNLLLVDAGMDEETRSICEKLCGEYVDLIMCDQCQVGNLLQRSIVET